MTRVFAEFRHHRLKSCDIVKCRHDTRIYLGEQQPNTQKSGECVGAFYLQNPGSAEPTIAGRKLKNGLCRWAWGPVLADPLMKTLIDLLDAALLATKRRNPRTAARLEKTGYVQLLNLSCVCNAPKAKLASDQWHEIVEARKDKDDVVADSRLLSFVVFGWGKDRYNDQRHAARVTRALSAACRSQTPLIFPTATGQKRSQSRAVSVSMCCSADIEVLRPHLQRDNVYPRGANDERVAFSAIYVKSLAPVLAKLLTKL